LRGHRRAGNWAQSLREAPIAVNAVVGLTLAGAALRFSTLDLQSFWRDEAVTVRLVRLSVTGMMRSLPSSESTPPLYYAVAWGWSKLFGTGEVGLRSLSALFGTATIPVAYGAAKQLISARAGVVTAGLTAVSPLLIWYSQEARSYALLVFLSALSLLFFAKALRESKRRTIVWWAVASALAIWTHYFGVFLAFAEALVLLSTPSVRRRALRPVAFVGLATAAIVPLAHRQERVGATLWIGAQPLSDRGKQLVHQFLVGQYLLEHITWLAPGIGLIGLAFLALMSDAQERAGGLLAGGLAAACIGLPLIVALAGKDYWFYRNVIGAWVPLAIALSAGLGARRATFVGPTIGVVLIGLSAAVTLIIFSRPSLQRDDWRGVAACIGSERSTRALVVAPEFEEVLRLYRPLVRDIPLAGHSISEIDVIGKHAPSFRVPAGFAPAGHSCLHSIPLSKFRAVKARLVRPQEILPEPGSSAVLIDARSSPMHVISP
jgi:mannosyltransferase